MGRVQIQMYDQYDVTLVHFHKKTLTCRLLCEDMVVRFVRRYNTENKSQHVPRLGVCLHSLGGNIQ